MTRYSPLPWSEHTPWSTPLRRLAAVALRRSSALLVRLARRLAVPVVPARKLPPTLEFYADSGAPEGALYLDGELVGFLPGVTRL